MAVLPPTPENYLSAQEQELLHSRPDRFPESGVAFTVAGYTFNSMGQYLQSVSNLDARIQDRYRAAIKASQQNNTDYTVPGQTPGQIIVAGSGINSIYAPTNASQIGNTGISRYQDNSLTKADNNNIAKSQSMNTSGVTSTKQGQLPGGEQLVIIEGTKAQQAVAYTQQLQGQPFQPGRLVDPSVNSQRLVEQQNNQQPLYTSIAQQRGNGPFSGNSVGDNGLVNGELSGSQTKIQGTSGFEQRIKGLQEREANLAAFEKSPGVTRIKDTASLLTGGSGSLFTEERGVIGRTAEKTLYGAMSWPLFFAPAIINAGEKISATGEAIYHPETRANILPEVQRAGIEAVQVYTKPETYTTAVLFAGLGGLSGAKTSLPVRTGMKVLYPKEFISPEATGIKFVEANTVSTPLSELRALEGKDVPTVHVTVQPPPFDAQGQFLTVAKPSGAGPMRSAYDLYNFYKSSPEIQGDAMTPRAYLGYAGIKSVDANAPSSGKVVYGNPTITLLTSTEKVSATPRSFKTIEQANTFQIQQGGKTFVPAENIALKSTEGQLINPSKYVDAQGNPLQGYENIKTEGTVIRQTEPSKFTYYKQTFQNPNTNPVARVLWDVFGKKSQQYKFEIVPTEVKPSGESPSSPGSFKSDNTVDLLKYNSEYSQGSRTVQLKSPLPASGASSTSSNSQSITTSQSSISNASPSVSNSPSQSLSVSPIISPSPSPYPSNSRPSTSISQNPSNSRSLSSSNSQSLSPIISPSPQVSTEKSKSPYPQSPSNNPSTGRTPPPTYEPVPKMNLSSESKSGGLFDVQVRRFGKFARMNTQGLRIDEAVKLGQSITDTTAAASFRITPAGSTMPISGSDKTAASSLVDAKQFTVSKRDKNIFVERNTFRINTVGEKSEIKPKGPFGSTTKRRTALWA